jgi:hypothetical protein
MRISTQNNEEPYLLLYLGNRNMMGRVPKQKPLVPKQKPLKNIPEAADHSSNYYVRGRTIF